MVEYWNKQSFTEGTRELLRLYFRVEKKDSTNNTDTSETIIDADKKTDKELVDFLKKGIVPKTKK